MGKFNEALANMTPAQRQGLISAGLGILASPSYGNFGQQVGKGGLIGMQGYNEAQRIGLLSDQQKSADEYRKALIMQASQKAQAEAAAEQKRLQDLQGGQTSQAIPPEVPQALPGTTQIPINAPAANTPTADYQSMGFDKDTEDLISRNRNLPLDQNVRDRLGWGQNVNPSQSDMSAFGNPQDMGASKELTYWNAVDRNKEIAQQNQAPQVQQAPPPVSHIGAATQALRQDLAPQQPQDPLEQLRAEVAAKEADAERIGKAGYTKESDNLVKQAAGLRKDMDFLQTQKEFERGEVTIDNWSIGKNNRTDQEFILVRDEDDKIIRKDVTTAEANAIRDDSRRAGADKNIIDMGKGKYTEKFVTSLVEKDFKAWDIALSSADNIEKLDRVLNHLKSSDTISGLGSELFKNFERLRSLVTEGKKSGKRVTDTELTEAFLGSDVFPLIKSLGIGARGLDTKPEREFLQKVFTGEISMSKETLIKMTMIRRNMAVRGIEKWNRRAKMISMDALEAGGYKSRSEIMIDVPEYDDGYTIEDM